MSDVEKVVDHAWILRSGRLVKDCSLDDLREDFCRVRLEAAGGEIPADLEIPEALDLRRDRRTALITIQRANLDRVKEIAAGLGCESETQPLRLEEVFEAVHMVA